MRPWSASRNKKMHRFLAATESCLCQIMVVSVVLVKCWSGFCSPCQVLVWFRVTVQTLSSAGLVSCHSADLQPCQCKSHALLVVVGINPVMVRTAVSCHGHSASSRALTPFCSPPVVACRLLFDLFRPGECRSRYLMCEPCQQGVALLIGIAGRVHHVCRKCH